MATQKPKRNPYIGALLASVFIGFGVYRLYNYYIMEEPMESWKLILAYAFVAYGAFVFYTLFTQRNDS
jgi:TM2 domain-containing membrane protein YozV